MRKIIAFLIGMLLLPTLVLAEAQINTLDEPPQSTYQIELIVFRYLNAHSRVEDWQNPTLINTSNAIDLVLPEFSVDNQISDYCLLPTDKLLLNKEATRLSRNPNYQMLLHIGWTQSIPDKWHSKPVHIAGGQNFTIEGEFSNEIEGTVSLSQNKFITFKTNLCFTEPSESIRFTGSGMSRQFYNLSNILSYHLLQNRRMKTGELNYIDNPNFGVLVKIVAVAGAPKMTEEHGKIG